MIKSIFITLLLIFYALLVYTYFTVPENMAIHFSLGGDSNGWMSKIAYLITFGFLGTFAPLLTIRIFYKFRYSPKDTINIPNRDYWLAPERIQQTISDLMNYGIWFASVTLFIFIGIGFLILDANLHPNVHRFPFEYGIVLLLIPPAILSWKFIRHFKITA
jgi:serine/threonine-protein kinase